MKLILTSILFALAFPALAQTPKKPRLSLKTKGLVGDYVNLEDSCYDSLEACEEAHIRMTSKGLVMWFGGVPGDGWRPTQYFVRMWEKNGVIIFAGSNYGDDCDNPGCGNMVGVSGVIYPKYIRGAWRIAIKTRHYLNYPAPDDFGAPAGRKTYVFRFFKARLR